MYRTPPKPEPGPLQPSELPPGSQAPLEKGWGDLAIEPLTQRRVYQRRFVPVPELLFDLKELYTTDFYEPKACVVVEFNQELSVARRMTVELEDMGKQKAFMSTLDKQIEAQRMKGEANRTKAADEQGEFPR